MQTPNRLLSDLAHVASGSLGVLAGVRGDIEALVRKQVRRLLGDMELVSCEEFEAVKAMAAKAREEQERLGARITALEAANSGPKKRAPRKPVAKAAKGG
jgi:BMFP domain-containing protein YqiC